MVVRGGGEENAVGGSRQKGVQGRNYGVS